VQVENEHEVKLGPLRSIIYSSEQLLYEEIILTSNKIESTTGVKINVEDLGGTGIPVVFIHGWPVNHNMFEYQFTELPKHNYRCFGIDLRGFGDSDKPWDGYNYDTMADDVHAVLNFLNISVLEYLNLMVFSSTQSRIKPLITCW
jgi:pimeloyl-ACP methyl ester carboxylesterase